ncbi:alanine racemase [Metarhizium acridum CQMa 102]|uniref:Alanine racemase n=1 Tax=Metarhizium acridum (strain CQMa 102) TaxID=655827 RepID=E9E2M0_METAQ|nr:alanine racemase [Metarhizium acridum CQMa 102]EFY89909.1 alanine racemase [Metarhizium acridum CQMa 102]
MIASIQGFGEDGANGNLCNGTSNGLPKNAATKENNWQQPGPAAFDFRSDIMTTPTARMLDAIAATTLLDDDFRQDPTTLGLESWVAQLTGKEAGLFVVSGTMGNLLSIRTHLQGPPHSVMCDYRSHIVTHEAGGIASLCGAMVQTVEPANGRYLTLEDLGKKLNRGTLVTDCPTRLVSLECPLGGVIMPLSECQRISKWAREHGVFMHLDGARLWEAVAAGAASLQDYCACFDSVSLCFSKGLGAPIGSIIVGTEVFRERARWLRKSIGGGMRQAGVVCSAARVAVEDTFLGGKLQLAHSRARQIARLWEGYGGKLLYPVETNMVWLDLDAVGMSEEDFIKRGETFGLGLMGKRLVVHYQISDEAVRRLDEFLGSCVVQST